MFSGIRAFTSLRVIAGAAALIAAIGFGAAAATAETTVRIGTEGAYPPFNEVDADGNLKGFDIDIAKALCEKMKVKCEFVAQDWDGIIPALQAKKYDAIVASMSITDERKKQVDFTDKYYNTPTQFVAAKGTDVGDASPAALTGKKLGAQGSTIQANMLEALYKDSTVKLYATVDELYADLTAGRVDAALVDKLVTATWLKTEAGSKYEFVGPAMYEPREILGFGVGIAVRKGDDALRLAFNKAIAEILADGTYKAINDKYFPFSIY
ncbi:ABC transporter substrate-binding protein [Zavarzinia compransoris]|uniref:Amino acid ABC transporter n=1 Tax=Zavarzinia compransoris TaxID=1264899 RepID=A0A317E682_9PROT|nr:ABC transporter substrate-binding protein [Zavarzinia compransoris]PWR20535.1 amino acid ABC transporter [Zavarzinia compransoris]TDP43820.1 amino acid ABC transporter substrate-binding protein (PAAT family) [Zavarzinia compransoris]